MEKREESFEVVLLGQRIVLKSSEKDSEIVRHAIELVSMKLKEVESRTKDIAQYQIALLALLDIAEEYSKLKKQTLDLIRQLDEKSIKLLNLIETQLGELKNDDSRANSENNSSFS